MKILFVINNFYTKGNGLAASARRTVYELRELGLDIKILSGANPNKDGEQPDYVLEDYKLPFFDNLVKSQGYSFSKSDKKIIEEALLWADIVHLEEPFFLQAKVCKIAKKLNKICTGTYHIHPENLFSSIGESKFRLFNYLTIKLWKKTVFDNCVAIQCPTENVKQRLVKENFKSKLYVISNGIVIKEEKEQKKYEEKEVKKKNGYDILCIGRFSREKDQMTLLKAMKYSKYSKEINLIFAGKGPLEEVLKKEANKLVSKGILKKFPSFGFYSGKELKKLSRTSELYIHCAHVEVEGLSCIESLNEGIVPIIAKGELTATSQFALSEKSTFEEKNPKELAKRIDYWLSNDKERILEAKKYESISKEYDIKKMAKKLVKMFEEAKK